MNDIIYLLIIHILSAYICCLKIEHKTSSKWALILFPELFHIYILFYYGLSGYFGKWEIKLTKIDYLVDRINMNDEAQHEQ